MNNCRSHRIRPFAGFLLAVVLGIVSRTTSAAQIIAVDFDGTAGDTPSTTPVTQSGFTSVTTNTAALPGGFNLTVTPSFNNGGGSGFFTRSGVTNSGAFTEAALYQDFFYSQNNSFVGNPSATFHLTGLNAGAQYIFTFYTYDQSPTIEGPNGNAPFTTSFNGTVNTTGSGTIASYIPGQTPTVNEQYTSTGTYSSTTSTVDIVAAITSNHDFLRINGFTVSTVPEPASTSLLGLSAMGLLARRRKAR